MPAERTVQERDCAPVADTPFASHAVRLSGRQWLVAATVILAVFVLAPAIWERIERFDLPPDYRIPYALSNDYWLFSRYCRLAASQPKTLVIGDSVIWAQYVRRDQTLPHYLNETAAEDRFVNMGVDGTHPAALAGLLKHHGRAILGRKVIMHCNLLWTSSKRHDLQIEKEFHFNHPRLVPQFIPRIPCYAASHSEKLGVIVERAVPFLGWTNHLRLAYFDQTDIPSWTLEHPYRNPAKAVTRTLPSPADSSPHEPIPWTDKGLPQQDFQWVELDTSFQWRCFQRTLATLRQRKNTVFVLVGPFNEHMLTPASAQVYQQRKDQVAAWLRDQGIAHYVPPPLPSEHYGDASHPLAQGYALLAKQLFEDEAFRRFDAR